jgi:hypothetical protein
LRVALATRQSLERATIFRDCFIAALFIAMDGMYALFAGAKKGRNDKNKKARS